MSAQDAEQLAGGTIRFDAPGARTPGIVSPLLRINSGGLYRAVVSARGAIPLDAKLHLHVRNAQGEWLGPEVKLHSGETRYDFFVPHRIGELQIFLLGHAPNTGSQFTLAGARLEKIDAESHFRNHRKARTFAAIRRWPQSRPGAT